MHFVEKEKKTKNLIINFYLALPCCCSSCCYCPYWSACAYDHFIIINFWFVPRSVFIDLV